MEAALDEQESDIKSRIPEGAEATNVLVGTLDDLEDSVLAFVRLSKGCNLGQVSEVSIPVRFLFVMLGPSKYKESYHQVGRSIATLMSDQVSKSNIPDNSYQGIVFSRNGKNSRFGQYGSGSVNIF